MGRFVNENAPPGSITMPKWTNWDDIVVMKSPPCNAPGQGVRLQEDPVSLL